MAYQRLGLLRKMRAGSMTMALSNSKTAPTPIPIWRCSKSSSINVNFTTFS